MREGEDRGEDQSKTMGKDEDDSKGKDEVKQSHDKNKEWITVKVRMVVRDKVTIKVRSG